MGDMVDVLNRLTLELRRQVDAADFPPHLWIVDPDLSAVIDVPPLYWKIEGQRVMEMNLLEKAAVEDSLLRDARETGRALLEVEFLGHVATRYPDHRRQLLLSLLAGAVADGLARRTAYVRRLTQWIEDGVRSYLFPAQDAVRAATTPEAIEAIELDLDDWLGCDPGVSVREALELDE